VSLGHFSLGVLFLAALSFPAPAPCQELGVSYTVAGTDNPEFPDPHGFTAHALMALNQDWFFRGSLHRVKNETEKDGRVCRLVPHIGCKSEETHTSLALSGLRLGVIRSLRFGDKIRVLAGGGFSFNTLSGRSVGVSGLQADLLVPKGGQIGTFGTLSLAMTPYPRVPIAVVGGINAHWVNFNACSGGDPPQHDPFCNPSTFRELEVGLSYPVR